MLSYYLPLLNIFGNHFIGVYHGVFSDRQIIAYNGDSPILCADDGRICADDGVLLNYRIFRDYGVANPRTFFYHSARHYKRIFNRCALFYRNIFKKN